MMNEDRLIEAVSNILSIWNIAHMFRDLKARENDWKKRDVEVGKYIVIAMFPNYIDKAIATFSIANYS